MIGLFFVAQLVGIASQVPGGIGVFEGVILLGLAGTLSTPALLSALVIYRLVYYVLPLAVAAGILAVGAVRVRTGTITLARTWVNTLVPTIFAIVTLLAGGTLLVSGALPTADARMAALSAVVPLGAIEVSHLLANVVGACLLVLARGLQLRLRVAYDLVAVLLGAGIVLSLLRGLSYESAAVLGAVFLLLLPTRAAFHREATLTTGWITPGWIAAVFLIVGASIWIGAFAHGEAEYSHALWWQFTLGGDASRFLRGSVGAAAVVLLVGISWLFRPAPPESPSPTDSDLERA